MLLTALVYSSTPPPFTLSLDQSPPCPRAINDAWLRQSHVVTRADRTQRDGGAGGGDRIGAGAARAVHEAAERAVGLACRHPKRRDPLRRAAGTARAAPAGAADKGRWLSHRQQQQGVHVRDAAPAARPRRAARRPGHRGRQHLSGLDRAQAGAGRLDLEAAADAAQLAMHASGLPREWPLGSKTHTEAEILASIGNASLQFPMYAHTAYSTSASRCSGARSRRSLGRRGRRGWSTRSWRRSA